MATDLIIPIVASENGPSSITIKMASILAAEGRAPEIAAVTPHKAPELLVTFNKAYLDLTQTLAQLRFQLARAEDEMNKTKARILIDKVPDIIKSRGLASSADIRQAIIDSDPEYQLAKERVDFMEATLEYIKGKIKFMENSYSSVKKIIGEQNWNMVGRAGSAATSAGREDDFGKPL